METNGRKIAPVIDHIGMNVPDIEAATTFLQQALDARVIYESYSKEQPVLEVPDSEAAAINLAPKSRLHACRMIQIGNGTDIELFEIHVDGQKQPVKSSDLGIQHFAIYTDDLSTSLERFKSAGGKPLSEPNALLFPKETGNENFFCYALTPWGACVEFITYPSGMPYEKETRLRRWGTRMKQS